MGFVEHPTDLAVLVVMGLAVALILNPDWIWQILLYPGKKLYDEVYQQFDKATKTVGKRAPPLPQQKTIVVGGNEYTATLSPEGQKDNERGIWSVPWLPGASYRL